MRRYHKNDNGFTMAEMLITVAIIVILCGFGFVAVIAHQRNLKRMEMDETAQEIFIAAQNHLTAAEANGQWDAFLKKTSGTNSEAARGVELANGPTGYDKTSDKDADSRKFYSFTTESNEAVQKGAASLILPEGSIDETLRGHHFYVEYDAMSGTVYGVFYTDADHDITADDAEKVSRTDPNARRDYKDANGKRTIIGYYGGALGELKNSEDLYAPSVAVRNAESLVLYVVDKNYYRPVSSQKDAKTFKTQLKLTFEGETSKATMEKTVDPDTLGDGDPFSESVLACKSAKKFSVVVPGRSAEEGGTQTTKPVYAEYYAIVLDSIVREDGHFADLFSGSTSGENGGNTQFIPGEDIKITVTLHSDKGGEDVSQTVRVNSLFNSVKTEKNFLGLGVSKTIVTVSNPRHLENLSTEVSGVDFTQIKSGTTIDAVSVVRNLFWDEDAAAEKAAKEQNEKETVTAFLPAIASATGMESPFGYCAEGKSAENTKEKENIRIYPYAAGTEEGNAAAEISKGACYGITNTEIQNLEGNNHILAAFRFEGEQKAALINEVADGVQISDLVIADATAVVTGRAASGSETDSGETPTAAILIADAKSGSIDNIAVRWYEESAADGTANPQVDLSQDKNHEIADGLQGCRIFSSEGIASVLIGSIDAGAESASGTFTIQHTTVATVAPSASGKKTASLGVEGETAAILIGRVKSGAVSVDNSSETDETKRSTVAVEGPLSVEADCGTKEKQTAGALIGSVDGGKVELRQFVFSADSMEISGGAAAGGVIGQIQSETEQAVSLKDLNLAARSMKVAASEQYAGGLIGADSGKNGTAVENVNLSLNTLEVNGKLAAGGAVGQVSAGTLSLKETNILTSKAAGDSGEVGQEETEDEDQYGIRVTADNGTAGGLLGSATDKVTELTIQDTAVSGSGTADQVEAGSSAGGLIGDTKASTTTIRSSMASLYIRSKGNGGNSGGSSSTDGAGGLIGSASGNVTVESSYSGGRTTKADDPEKKAGDASEMQARYVDRAEGQGRYNVQLESGSGAAGGLIGKYTGGNLKLTDSYSTSSVAVSRASGAKAGGLIGEAAGTLTANNTYCTGRVYVTPGAGEISSSTKEESTPNYGTYAGKLGGISGQSNYYLKGMKGAPAGAIGTLNGNSQNPSVDEKTLTGADYYDEKCPLKQKVDPAQKSYYFDETIGTTAYPFQTKTVRNARPVCDPDTGVKDQNAEADASRFAQVGDWEIPAEESAEGTYGLIYYERIWDGMTNSLDPTFYYHGYMLESGNNAHEATYREVQSKEAFVTGKNKYVSESGYLLVIKKGAEKNLFLCFGKQSEDVDNAGFYGKKVDQLEKNNLDGVADFSGYNAYDVTLNINTIQNFCYLFWPDQNKVNQFGTVLALRESKENTWNWTGSSKAAFTYVPFFADAVKPTNNGKFQTVSKTTTADVNGAQAIIRGGEQLKYFIECENQATSNNGFLNGSQRYIVEQQLDITFDQSKVTFTVDEKTENRSAYVSNTLNQIGSKGVFRSSLRTDNTNDKDFYVLDGLRNNLVKEMHGELYNFQITDVKAPYFIQNISRESANVHDISIKKACFGGGQNYDQKTSGGFAEKMDGGVITNCYIDDATIYGNGFIKEISNDIRIENCGIKNATISGNGVAEKIDINSKKVDDKEQDYISNFSIENAVINKNGFAQEITKGQIRKSTITKTKIEKTGFAETISAGTYDECSITDAEIGENGFANTVSSGEFTNCTITNAKVNNNGFAETIAGTYEKCKITNALIGENGFAKNSTASLSECGIFADASAFSDQETDRYYAKYYRPLDWNNNQKVIYNYTVIGTVIDNGKMRPQEEDVAGFILNQSGQDIKNCYVTGCIYGSKNVYGFIKEYREWKKIDNCYVNAIINAGANACGFIGNAVNSTISNCHALGIISTKDAASGFIGTITSSSIENCYEAFWKIDSNEWYPFYQNNNNPNYIQLTSNYYLTDYLSSATGGSLVDYADKAKGFSYHQLASLKMDGLMDQADTTVGYYQYMPNDSEHQVYPYPMPSGMTAYGDWSYEDPDRYTLLYYEKVNGEYYFHGYVTEDGENYNPVGTSGANLENGLLAETDKTVTEDGYILITGANGSWSAFGRADNSGNVSSPINNANTSIFKDVPSDTDLQNALKDLKKKDTDKIYAFQLDKYLAYEDTTKNFASWQTLTKESGGIGISVYSTKGMTPMAKFSFQPFFADTVKGAQVSSNGSTADKKISFVVTTDGDEDHDYRIRSLRQLQALSDWDAGIWKNTTVADSSKLEESFDKDDTKRYSYLSTSNENYTSGLKIRQDMDINVDGANVNFDRLNGIYAGRQYSGRSVMLQNLKYDFADVVAPSGKVSSLLIDQAKLQGSATTKAQNGDIAHGGQREFVEYNYGNIQNITIQNSELGSAGLVYQNGDVPENVTVETRGDLQKDDQFGYWNPSNGHNIYRYITVISYQIDNHVKAGTISGCKIQKSSVNGAGFVWSNEGGTISESTVINCNSVADVGFVKYNRSTYVEVVQQIIQYEYWDGKTWTGDSGGTRVSEEFVKQKGWPLKSEGDTVLNVSVPAMINNCQVIDCTVKGNGFVGENTVNTVGSSADNNSGAKAKISNCQVYGTSSYSDMKIGSSSGAADVNKVAGFVGNNGKGAEIENCSVTGQVGGLKNVAGFALTNAGTITGSYANTKITCEGNQETMLSGFVLTNTGTIDRSHSLGEESCKQVSSGAYNRAAGFVVSNQKATDSSTNAVIRNSYAAMWKLELNGTEYVPFGSKDSPSGAGSYDNCYAMKLSADDGYSGTYPAASSSEITYVSGEDLQKKYNDDLGNAAEDGKTTAYQAELKSTNYPFPCGSTIMNYGDWKLTDGNSAATHTITLAAGSKAVFPEDLVRSLSADAAVMAASDDGNTENADEAAITGIENAYGQDTIPEEDRHEVQLELGEEEETLDLAELVPVRKGWKLLGWLITAPSELTASTEKTTVSDIVTKVTKVSDGSAEAEDADAQNTENAGAGAGDSEETEAPKAVYQLETGTKSYHFAPDAVITVTEDMTLSAVWVPDDGTIEKAKDGTLRMDENGAILDGEEQVTNDVTNETTETDLDASAADTSSAVTGDDTDGMTSENQDASTDQTADASGTLPAQNTEDDMSEMSDLTGESDPEMETSTETTGEEGDPAGE